MKPISQMNLTDYRNIITTYKEMKKGNWHQRRENNLSWLEQVAPKKRNQMQFPLMVSSEQMKYMVQTVPKKKYQKAWDKGEPKEVDILFPTSWGEIMQGQILE